jgi:undecaprenyl phosphate N,N'-diacetylbacillosamine 1-phosphate transferase
MYRKFFKRVFDIVSSGAVILLLLPFFIIFTPIVAIAMKGNPFFVQKRPGKDCKIFKMIKYRTMTNAKDKEGNLLPDEDRLTGFGNLMRKLSIDELPELFNIFKGDMSVVGPRPQLIKDMIFFDDEIMKRQSVRPGLTGLAQVRGRNNISWEEKFKYDLEYIEKITFFKDIKIIFKTVFKVLKSSDITAEGMATAEDYGDYLLRNEKVSQEEYTRKIEATKR